MTYRTGWRDSTLQVTNPSTLDDLKQRWRVWFPGKTYSLNLQDVSRHHNASTPRPGWLVSSTLIYCFTYKLLYLDEQYKDVPSKLQCNNHTNYSCCTPSQADKYISHTMVLLRSFKTENHRSSITEHKQVLLPAAQSQHRKTHLHVSQTSTQWKQLSTSL